MNKNLLRKLFIFSISYFVSVHAMGAFTLNGTRFIYPQEQKAVSFEITNHTTETYGGQIWIDNANNDKKIYIIPQPSFFKVGAGLKQVVRLIRTSDALLPEERESLFWLTVQEIPPLKTSADKYGENNILSLAMGTRVKIIYRPMKLKDGRKNAESKIELLRRADGVYLRNPTPYYFAVGGVKVNGKYIRINKNTQQELYEFAPFSEVNLAGTVNGKLTVDAIDDWGAIRTYTVVQ